MKYRPYLLLLVFLVFYLLPSRNIIISPEDYSTITFFSSKVSFVNAIGSMLAFFMFSISAYTILFKFYPIKKYIEASLLLIISIPLVILFRYLLQEVIIYNLIGINNYMIGYEMKAYFFDNYGFAASYVTFGIIFFFIQYAQYSEKKKNELIIATEKTKLSFLKSQINPHFLFNSLNNIYALVYKNSDQALPSLDILSRMLRYSLYNAGSKTTLSKEIEYIKHFIELETMRYDLALSYSLEFNEGISDYKITPFVLINFVENAFKHGIVTDPEKPIIIRLVKIQGGIEFYCENFISDKRKDEVGGIGLTNTIQRLDIVYGSDHNLNIVSDINRYQVQLKIMKEL